ncbi:MAG: hypothetical protein KIH69_011410 [Anaerolineae bacterium]|nr:hypothetical protein [Anaerolineae bacterium]
MSKKLLALIALVVALVLCGVVVVLGMFFFRTSSNIAPAKPTSVPTLVVIASPIPNLPTSATSTVSATRPNAPAPTQTALPQPSATPRPAAAATPTSSRGPQTLSVTEAQASSLIAERIEAAKMPLSNVRVTFNDNQTIELLGTAQIKMPILGTVSGPLKVLIQPVVRNEKLEAEVTRIQFNGLDITEAYKENVELGVNQAFEGILGNRRVQSVNISNHRMSAIVLP